MNNLQSPGNWLFLAGADGQIVIHEGNADYELNPVQDFLAEDEA